VTGPTGPLRRCVETQVSRSALGTSHRMLIYHFGSKEGLFVAVVQEADRRQRQLLASSFGTKSPDLDVLATGDVAGADAAYDAYLATLLDQRAGGSGGSGGAPA